MIRRLLYLCVFALTILGFVYLGGGQALHRLGDHSLRLERGLKRKERALRKAVHQVRDQSDELSGKLKDSYRGLRDSINTDQPRTARSPD